MQQNPLKMRLLIALSFLLFTNCGMLFGQKIEIFGGINKNVFHDYNKDEGHFMSSYNSGLGYCAGIGIDSIKYDIFKLRFTLQVEQYKGKLIASDGGLGSGYQTIADVNKSIISLGFYPLNLRFFKSLDVNLGVVASGLIHESFKGTKSGWSILSGSWSNDLQNEYKRFSSKLYLGLQGRIGYDFKISKSISISPQYLCYFGLSNEFIEFPKDTKSMRHYFCVGLKKNIGKSKL